MKRGLLIVPILYMVGCASLTPEQVDLITNLAGQAVAAGTEIWISTHPAQRQAFNSTIVAVGDAMKSGDNEKAVTLLHSLPTDAFNGRDGSLYVSTYLVVYDNASHKATVANGKLEGPVLKATLSGLKRGIAPHPPMPSSGISPRTYRMINTPVVTEQPAPIVYHVTNIVIQHWVTNVVYETGGVPPASPPLKAPVWATGKRQ